MRAGLGARPNRRAFQQYTQPMGLRPGLDLDKALRLAGAIEDEEFGRKLEMRK